MFSLIKLPNTVLIYDASTYNDLREHLNEEVLKVLETLVKHQYFPYLPPLF